MTPNHRRYRLIIAATLVILVSLPGCSRKATPDPSLIARAVAATLTAMPSPTPIIVEVTRVVEKVVTATPTPVPTPTPTPTSAPTATPTALPSVVVPEGWKSYTALDGSFAVSYPRAWQIEEEGTNDVMINDGRMRFIAISAAPTLAILDFSRPDDVAQALVEFMAETTTSSNLGFKLIEKGMWDDGVHVGAFVKARMRYQSTGPVTLDSITMAIALPFSRFQAVYMEYVHIGTTELSAQEIETIKQISASVRPPSAVIVTPTPPPEPYVQTKGSVVNIRQGPSTLFPIVGKMAEGSRYRIIGKTRDGQWWQICCVNEKPAWVAAWVVEAIGDTNQTAIVQEIPTPPPTPTPEPQANPAEVFPGIGETVTADGWEFKVYDVKKRKAVYFYGKAYIAQGHFLLVFVEAVNRKSGTSYFGELKPYVTDKAGNAYFASIKGSSYAQWQYEGLDSFYTDVNPGNRIRMVHAYDLPDDVGDVMLSLNTPMWIYLGNFSSMPSEDG